VAPFQRLSTLVVPCSSIGFCNITAELFSRGFCSWPPENVLVAPKGGRGPRLRNAGRRAILMAAAMTSRASAILGIERFTSALQERFMSRWWQWSKVENWNFTIKTFKTCQFNESRHLFVGLNLNTIVQEKAPETCTFHWWCVKNKEH